MEGRLSRGEVAAWAQGGVGSAHVWRVESDAAPMRG